MIDVQKQSQELLESYRQLDDQQIVAAEDLERRALTAEEAKYAASQAQLLWRRFSRNKAAIAGGVVVALFYLVALFGNFIVPYTLETRFSQGIYLPPQPIHLFDQGRFQPFVYGMKSTFDKNLRRIRARADRHFHSACAGVDGVAGGWRGGVLVRRAVPQPVALLPDRDRRRIAWVRLHSRRRRMDCA